MIAVNGKKIDLNDQTNDFVRLVYEPSMKLLKSLGLKRYTFGEVEEKKTITKEGIVEHSSGSNPQWRARCAFKNEKGQTFEYFVQYFETSTLDKDGNELFMAGPNKTRWSFDGNPTPVNFETKPSLVWWLVFACGECELVPGISDWQNQIRSPKPQYRLMDSAKDASKIVNARKAIARAEMLILNDETEGGLDETTIRYLCQAHGIGNVAKMSPDECRNALHTKVIVKDGPWNRVKTNLVNEFLDMIKEVPAKGNVPGKSSKVIEDDAALKALVFALTEGDTPILKHVNGAWMMGETVIKKHKFSIDKIEALMMFFRENPSAISDYEKMINKT